MSERMASPASPTLESGPLHPTLTAGPHPPAPSPASRRGGASRSRFWRSRRAVGGLCILLLIILGSAAAPLLAPADPLELNPRIRLVPPLQTSSVGSFHLLGTDQVGRDLFS